MTKTEADYCKKLEVWWLLRDVRERGGYKNSTIKWGEDGSHGSIGAEVYISPGSKWIRFRYNQTDRFTGEKTDFDYKVHLTTTPCNFGGERYWFICPLSKNGKPCGKRIGVLYKDGDYFGCRNCYELTYSSRNANRGYKHFPLFRTLDLSQQMDKLWSKIKTWSYDGKLTKKAKRYKQLEAELHHYYGVFQDTEKNDGWDT
jgi:hypothetical protein